MMSSVVPPPPPMPATSPLPPRLPSVSEAGLNVRPTIFIASHQWADPDTAGMGVTAIRT